MTQKLLTEIVWLIMRLSAEKFYESEIFKCFCKFFPGCGGKGKKNQKEKEKK